MKTHFLNPPPPPDPISGLYSARLNVEGFFLWVAPVVLFSVSDFGFFSSSQRLRDSLPPSFAAAWSRSFRAASISFSRSARITAFLKFDVKTFLKKLMLIYQVCIILLKS